MHFIEKKLLEAGRKRTDASKTLPQMPLKAAEAHQTAIAYGWCAIHCSTLTVAKPRLTFGVSCPMLGILLMVSALYASTYGAYHKFHNNHSCDSL